LRTIILIFRGELTGGAKESEIRGRYWPIVTDLPIAHHRLRNQRLTGPPFEKPEQVVRWLTAVQSQDYAGAKWAIAQRVKQVADDEIDKLFNAGKILRTHLMRPTWHFVMPSDIRWMLKLTAPRVNAVSAYYYRKLELDEALFRRSNAAITKALHGGTQLTRTELANILKRAGIDAAGVRLAYLILRAELDAVVCSGGLRGKQFTYAFLDERVPKCTTLEREEALAELTRRYFTSHGPALLRDYTWWSGLTAADAKAGIELARPHLDQWTVDSKTYWFGELGATAKTKAPLIHLLPNYDEYLIAYKDRSNSINPSLQKHSGPSDGVFNAHIIVMNGQVIGGWRRTIEKDKVTITANPLMELGNAEQRALRQAAERYGEFLGKSAVSLEVHKSGPYAPSKVI
jgi:winged helix DNA-binding protein